MTNVKGYFVCRELDLFMPKNIVLLLFILPALQSCIVPHKSFVAPGFEPVTIKKKGDIEMSASIRPFKFYKFNATVALTDNLALRAGYSGFPGLDNFDGSAIVFKNYQSFGFFAAATYNYQHNVIGRSYSFSMWGVGRNFHYNAQYHSPGVAMGVAFSGRNGNSHHLILKVSYNIVRRYEYAFSSNTASGKDSGYYVRDEEALQYKLPGFYSFEPSYSYVSSRPGRRFHLRYQLAFNICETVLRHRYVFETHAYGGPETEVATRLHPVFSPVNVSIGFIFRHNSK